MRKLLLIILCAFLSMGAASRSFDGANDEVDMGVVLDVTTGNVSICVWIKTTQDATSDFMLGKVSDGTGATAGYGLFQSLDEPTHLISDATEFLLNDSATDSDGIWYWDCGTWNSTTEFARILLNGVETDSDTGAGNIDSLSNAVEFAMGETGNEGTDYLGLMAYGMQYGAVLNDVEINELMWKPEIIVSNRGGFWPLWGDSTEIDLSGNGRVGTLQGTTASTDGPPVAFGYMMPI